MSGMPGSELQQNVALTPDFRDTSVKGLERSCLRPRRVLITLDAVGGIWRHAMELGRYLNARGISITYLGFGPQPQPEQEAEARDIGILRWCNAPLEWMAGDDTELQPVQDIIASTAAESGADLVHLNSPSQAAGLELDVPVVSVSHSCVVTWFRAIHGGRVPEELAWHYRLNKEGLESSDAVVVPSAAHGALLRSAYGPQPHLHVVHNGVGDFGTRTHKASFVFAAGRWWDEGKNAKTLDKAAQKIDWPVLMAGPLEGPNRATCTLEHATHCGALPYPDVRRLMARASVVVSPSLYEPFGLAALEAAQAGTPLVLADIPVYRELWDGAALFAQPDSASAFAAAISRLMRDPDLQLQLGSRARSRARRFSLERQGNEMLGIYAQALARKEPLVETLDV